MEEASVLEKSWKMDAVVVEFTMQNVWLKAASIIQ